MSGRSWIILTLAIVMVLSLVTYTGVTHSFFVDDEYSTDDTLGIRWGLFTLNDGFENTGSPNWDGYWDESGATTWVQDSAKPHTGYYNAYSDQNNNGYLTSDEIEASSADNISVIFWFNLKNAEAGDIYVQTYNGTTYNNWYDLTAYPTYINNTWCQFSEIITDSQYLIAGFRLRFNTTGLVENSEEANIDDVVITTDTIPPANPAGLTATAGSEQIILDWNDNVEDDIWGYNVYRSTTSGANYTQINGSPVYNSNYTDTPLYGGGLYYYVVSTIDYGNNESGYSNEDSATAVDVAPAAPTDLVASAGNEEITLDWNDNNETDNVSYAVYRSSISGGNFTQISSLLTSSNYTDSPLYGGGLYYYVVTAVDGGSNESSDSNEDSATAVDVAPAAPTGLVATGGNEEITLDWNDNIETDLDGYDIYRSTSSGGPYDKVNGSLVYSSEYTDSNLFGGGLFYYVVKAIDGSSNVSGYSNEDSATATDIAPSAPTGLTATGGTEQITLNWDDNIETDLASYNVYRSTTSSANYTQINGSPVYTSEYTDSPIYGTETYYYVITAVDDGSNESGYSNEDSATTGDAAPSAPTALVASIGSEQITLDWDNNIESDLASYNVYRSTTSGANYTQINGSPVYTSNYTDSPLYGGGMYYYVVTAVDNGSNESVYSNEDSATATDAAPAAPLNLSATAGNEQITLDWGDNGESDFASYNVYRSLTSGANYTQVNGSPVYASNYIDLPLYGSQTYYYVVTAVDDGANESGNSNEDSATTIDIAPAAPSGLSATAGDGLVSLDWNDNTEADIASYNVYRSTTSGANYTQINGSPVYVSGYDDNSVSAGITYYYVVTAVDDGSNESGNSNEDNATPYDNPPAAPANLAATAGDKQVTLDWDDNTEGDIDGYNVYRSLTSGANYTQINGSLLGTSEYIDNNVTGNVTYYYVVTAVDLGSNESVDSNEDSATPWDNIPVAPTGLVATKGVGQASLDWNDNGESDLDGYNVYRSTTSGSGYSKINGSIVTDSDYIDSTVTNGTRYYYVVTAVDEAAQESDYSNEDNARPVGPPQNLLSDDFEGNPWDVKWDGNGITDWQISYVGGGYNGSTYGAEHKTGDTTMTSDSMNAYAAEYITVSFWFNIKLLNKGPLYVQTFNGTDYNNWFDLVTYPGVIKTTWIYFSEVITDSQYWVSDFRLRFDGSGMATDARIDDVVIDMNN